MTELTFLVDLLLEHDLKPETKKAIAGRMRDVEEEITKRIVQPVTHGYSQVPNVSQHNFQPNTWTSNTTAPQQAPSTLAKMMLHGDIPSVPLAPPIESAKVEIIAHTPQAAAAMQSRQQVIADSLSGKVDKVTGRPRKF